MRCYDIYWFRFMIVTIGMVIYHSSSWFKFIYLYCIIIYFVQNYDTFFVLMFVHCNKFYYFTCSVCKNRNMYTKSFICYVLITEPSNRVAYSDNCVLRANLSLNYTIWITNSSIPFQAIVHAQLWPSNQWYSTRVWSIKLLSRTRR